MTIGCVDARGHNRFRPDRDLQDTRHPAQDHAPLTRGPYDLIQIKHRRSARVLDCWPCLIHQVS